MGKVSAGRFDRKVNLYRQTTVRTSSGEVVKSFTLHGGCFAEVQTKSVGESVDESVRLVSVQELTTYLVAEMDNSWRVEVDGEMYEVEGVEPVERRYMRVTMRRINQK